MGTAIRKGESPLLGKVLSASSVIIAGGGIVSHAAPALTAIGPIRSRLFPRLSGRSDSKAVALTFDDGPDIKSTALFLDKLDKYEWKATFFMLGSMAEKNPALTREVQSRGHEVAVHGYLHRNLLWRSPNATRDDIQRACETLSEITGAAPRFYRPPYGVLNIQALLTARRMSLTPVLWTAWGRDWRAKATPDSVIRDLSQGLHPGGTLLLHDSDCTSASGAYVSALGALDLLSDKLKGLSISVERLCDHFPD
ncbi:MAG: polysaccharide deacetylase family protein [Actinomycetota bacterium]|nr:MAG: polysaccharide deacetylase family protein [Actinomycetota bacterium]